MVTLGFNFNIVESYGKLGFQMSKDSDTGNNVVFYNRSKEEGKNTASPKRDQSMKQNKSDMPIFVWLLSFFG
jgi:hypothetical protein